MTIGGLQKLTLLDYPGRTACTIFLPGCNFRCPFCHNGSLVVPEKIEEGMGEEELFRFLKKRQGLLEGVCVTGGEPLAREGIEDFLEKIKACGYQVKLDTNGSFPEKLRKVVEGGWIDYVAMDVKNSLHKYKTTIGLEKRKLISTGDKMIEENSKMTEVISNKTVEDRNKITEKAGSKITGKIEQSIRYLLEGNIDYEFRTTVVKGLHTLEDMEEIGSLIAGARRYYIQNFVNSGDLVGSGEWMEPFSENELSKLLNAVKAKVPNSWIRGE